MKGKRTAWLLIGVLLAAQVGLAGVWGEEPLASDAGDAALILEQPQTEQPETDGDSTEEPVSTEGSENAVDALAPGTDSLEADALQEEALDDGFTDQSVVVDSSEVDMRAVEAQDTYFFVRYEDGTMEVREIDPVTSIGSLDANGDSEPVVDLEDYVSYYAELPEVEAAEPLLVRSICDIGEAYIPDDTLYDDEDMWGLKWIEADRLLRMIHQENLEEVIVAVIDTGMDMDHPDLQGVLASVDVGLAEPVHGYDLVNGTDAEPDYVPDDDNGHGTHVAGTIAAIANNGEGVVGVAAGVKILPIKVLDSNGDGNSVNLIKAIDWASEHGADVINLSLGGFVYSSEESQAIDRAVNNGVVVVAATGNDSNQWTEGVADLYNSGVGVVHAAVRYPAAHKHVIGVGAVGVYGPDNQLLLSDFSNNVRPANVNAALNPVDVVAPGEFILSTYPDVDMYATLSGTSMATPHVAAVAALLRASDPEMSPAEIEDAIVQSATMVTAADDPTYGGKSSYYGAGVINAYAALGGAEDTHLNDLTVTGAAFTFDPLQRSYLVNWDGVASIQMTPVRNNSEQVLRINDTPYAGAGAVTIPLADAGNRIVVEVTASDGETVGTYTILSEPLSDVPDGTVTMEDANTDVLLDGTYTAGKTLTLSIPAATTDATVTVPVVESGGIVSATLPAMSVTRSTSSLGTVTVAIPEGTVVSADQSSGWSGIISMPTVSSTTSATVSGGKANLSISLGSSGNALTFDKAIRILIPGMAGKSVGYVQGSGVTAITRVLSADNQAAGDAMPAGAEGRIDVGADLVIWTKHLTEFVAFTPTATQKSGGGGGGGGGGGVEAVIKATLAGQVSLDNIKLEFPEGSYSKDYKVTVSKVAYKYSPFDSTKAQIGDIYSVRKTVKGNLIKPYRVSLKLNPEVIREAYQGSAVHIYWLDTTTNSWKLLSGSLYSENTGVLIADTDLFTEFSAVAETAPKVKAVEIPVTAPTQSQPAVPEDLRGHWGEKAVETLIAKGAVAGYPDGSFRPDAAITRAEFLAILVKAQGMTGTTPSNFSDLNGHWAKGVIEKAMAYGITGGYADGLFRPDAPITREEMAVMIDRSLRYATGEPISAFSDGSEISEWAKLSLQRIVSHKIMGGYPDGSFRPQGLASRAEACSVIMKTISQ